MNVFDDSSDEMYNNDLSSSDVERLICGDIDSPVHADLIAMMSEVRNLRSGVPTPKPGAALSEFVGVGLVTNNNPVVTPDPGIDLRSTPTAAKPVTTRRNSVFAQIAAFAGTIGGKVVLSGAVAAASISGAHATGAVDVPFLPDTAAEIETINIELSGASEDAKAPEALTFADDKTEEIDKADLTDDLEKKTADEQVMAELAEKRATAELEKAELEKAELEKAELEKAELEKAELEKAELEKAELEKAELEKAELEKAELEVDAKVAALEKQLAKDKEAAVSAASADIAFFETKLADKKAWLEADLKAIDEKFAGYVADIDALIAATDDEVELADLKAYRENKLVSWEQAKADKEAVFAPYIADIEASLKSIETARDAKIDLLIASFNKAVEQVKS